MLGIYVYTCGLAWGPYKSVPLEILVANALWLVGPSLDSKLCMESTKCTVQNFLEQCSRKKKKRNVETGCCDYFVAYMYM